MSLRKAEYFLVLLSQEMSSGCDDTDYADWLRECLGTELSELSREEQTLIGGLSADLYLLDIEGDNYIPVGLSSKESFFEVSVLLEDHLVSGRYLDTLGYLRKIPKERIKDFNELSYFFGYLYYKLGFYLASREFFVFSKIKEPFEVQKIMSLLYILKDGVTYSPQ